jgi:peptide/nickel transport system substrate-binding protein/oligopeptide transport system substrate-binding protein
MVKKLVFIFIMMFLSFQIIGCDKPEQPKPEKKESAPKYGGIYRRAFPDPYILLDPASVKESNSNEICRQLYDGLVEFSASDTVVPCLAESWTISENKLVYTFKLRKDVHFHKVVNGINTKNGGRLFSAEDVLYSFKRLLSPNPNNENSFYKVIKGAKDYSEGKTTELPGIRVIASDTIEFELEHAFSPFISTLGVSNAFIVPHEDANNIASMPVGTGAFKWKGKTSNSFVLEANKEYFRGRPWLDGVEFVVIPKEEDRFNQYMAGKLQHVDLPDNVYQKMKHDPEYSKYIQESNLWGLNFLGMNQTKPPFDNKLVRQALNFSVDRESIVKLVLNGRAQSANGVLTPGIPGHDPLLPGYFYDLPRAKKLLAEAGYPDGKGFPEITLQINEDQLQQRVADFIVANLKDLGIECKINVVNFEKHIDDIENGNVPFFRLGWTIDYPDPDGLLFTLFHSSNIDKGYNYCRYSNPEVDKLLDAARNETELIVRVPLYEQAEKIIVDDAPMVFMYFYTLNILQQPNVRGLKIGAMGECALQYRRIWLE